MNILQHSFPFVRKMKVQKRDKNQIYQIKEPSVLMPVQITPASFSNEGNTLSFFLQEDIAILPWPLAQISPFLCTWDEFRHIDEKFPDFDSLFPAQAEAA